jgi:putative endonuclease
MTKNKLRHLIKGKTAESQAEIFLTKQGIKPITRNFSSRFGEIDLIGMDKKTLVFFEIRYRSSSKFGSAAETVNISKQKKIIRAAEYFLCCHTKYNKHPMRFDVIGINASDEIEWIKGAFLSAV